VLISRSFTVLMKISVLVLILCAFGCMGDYLSRTSHWTFDSSVSDDLSHRPSSAHSVTVNTTFGKYGGSLMITQDGAYVEVTVPPLGATDIINQNGTDWTLTAWVYLTADPLGYVSCVFCQWTQQFLFGLDVARQAYWEMSASGGTVNNTVRGPRESQAVVGQWYFMAASLDRDLLMGFGWDGLNPNVVSFYPIQPDQLNYASSNLLGSYRIGHDQSTDRSVLGFIDDVWLIPCHLRVAKLDMIRLNHFTSDMVNDLCADTSAAVSLFLASCFTLFALMVSLLLSMH